MSKKALKKASVKPRPDCAHDFHAFLAAADAVALSMMIREGIFTDTHVGHEPYQQDIERLAKEFCEPYGTTSIDNVIHFDEHEAKMEAAHMVGFALGLRLADANLTMPVRKGGAK